MLEKQLPEYYPTMYLDGYTPTEILFAMRKKMRREVQERRAQNPELFGIGFTANVEVKK